MLGKYVVCRLAAEVHHPIAINYPVGKHGLVILGERLIGHERGYERVFVLGLCRPARTVKVLVLQVFANGNAVFHKPLDLVYVIIRHSYCHHSGKLLLVRHIAVGYKSKVFVLSVSILFPELILCAFLGFCFGEQRVGSSNFFCESINLGVVLTDGLFEFVVFALEIRKCAYAATRFFELAICFGLFVR